MNETKQHSPRAAPTPRDGRRPAAGEPILVLEGVGKRYGATEALRNLDLTVHAGEIVAILGPNGAGKTTAISIMLGLRRASRGRVELFGAAPDGAGARSRVGVMLQESGVPGSLRVRELIELFQATYPRTLPTAELLARADLQEKAEALVATLSGGQKQRLYVALALAGDPDLLFLDEPTVGMDVAARRDFWEQVREFAGYGKAVLFSTHYLAEADATADRIVVIHHGEVIAEGSPAAIKRLVAEKTVRLRTELRPEEALALPGVQRATEDDGYLVVYCHAPEAFLAELFRRGLPVADLTVRDTDLETAFIDLTDRGRTAGRPAAYEAPTSGGGR